MRINELDARLSPGEPLRSWIDPVFRVATSMIFIIGGIGHFAAHDDMLQWMEESPWRDVVGTIGEPSWLLWLSGAVFVIFGITVAKTHRFQHIDRLVAVLNIGGVDENEDQKSASVGEDVTLATFDFLSRIIVPNPATFRWF